MIRNYNLHLLAIAISVFTLYLICMPLTVALEDDGLFILSSYFNGISHPPGYPLHALVGYFFTHLPFGEPAVNSHALSAFFSALSSVLVYLITARLTADKSSRNLTAYIAAFAYALALTVWSQSIISEVYTFNVFLFLSIFLCALKIEGNIEKYQTDTAFNLHSFLKKNTFYLGLLTGIALSNHWPLVVFGSLGVWFLIAKNYRYYFSNWLYIFCGLAIGLTPYVWMVINSNSDTFINYYGPLGNIKEIYDFISRKNFNVLLEFQPTATITDRLNYLIFTTKQLITQWGVINIIFVPLGIYAVLFTNIKNKKKLIAILISYLSASLFLVSVLGYEFNHEKRTNIRPFLVLAHSFGAIFFAIGVSRFIGFINKYSKKDLKALVLLVIVSQIFSANLSVNYRHNYIWSTIYAKELLSSVKPNSTVFISGDIPLGVLGYWHIVKGYRPDIKIIHAEGIVLFGTRLFDPRKIKPQEYVDLMTKYTIDSQTPVYFIDNKIKVGTRNHWLLYEYDKQLSSGKGLLPLKIPQRQQQYLDYVFSDKKYTDIWTIEHRNYLRLRASGYLLNSLSSDISSAERQRNIRYIKKLTTNLNSLSYILQYSVGFGKIDLFSSKDELIEKGWGYYKNEENRNYKSNFINALGVLKQKEGDLDESLKLYTQSINIWNHKKNKAHELLYNLKNNKDFSVIKNDDVLRTIRLKK